MASGFHKVGVDQLSEQDQVTRAEMARGGGDWKQIQLKAFTNWINERLRRPLKHSALQIGGLADMHDGIILIKLLEKVAKKKIATRFYESPNSKLQKVDNLGKALAFIKNEDVKLVNIGKC